MHAERIIPKLELALEANRVCTFHLSVPIESAAAL